MSGLAEGVDTAAMSAAIDLGGRVVGVIGTGIDHAYPAPNTELQATIAERGLILTQFLPGFRGARWAFPARNKTMSAYARATVIAEATEQSGTKHQALEAVAHGRRLVLHRTVAEGTTWVEPWPTGPTCSWSTTPARRSISWSTSPPPINPSANASSPSHQAPTGDRARVR